MNTIEITPAILDKARSWVESPLVDDDTKNEVQQLIDGDPKGLLEAFYADLEFGTGGLRGVMGVGSLRMNRYTVATATQGLANYIRRHFPGQSTAVAIAFDSRNRSSFFAETAAAILSANGIHVHMFAELRPTPLLSFAVRELKCQAGIVITASHNPKEYNGYKVYWEDGAQVLPPHDKGIITEVGNVRDFGKIRFEKNDDLIHSIGPGVEEAYLRHLAFVVHAKKEIAQVHDIRIVYTSIHGAGITMVPRALAAVGFTDIRIVEQQSVPDGNFPTVHSPNPEEKESLQMALDLANACGADMVLGTDPDTDRVGLAVRNHKDELALLNGNQAASILVYYELMQWHANNKLDGRQYIAKTIVTTDLLEEIARSYNVKWYDTLTGFKYIAGVIREKEGKEEFIAGGEESYGYSVGEFVRDKDAVLSSVVFCEIAAWCRANGISIWQLLMSIYEKHGLYHEELVSITRKGISGVTEIAAMMSQLRSVPPKILGGSRVAEVRDIESGTVTNMIDGSVSNISLPGSNVLQFILEDGSKISARPSGTEPKIKFYFSIREKFRGAERYPDQLRAIRERMKLIRSEMGAD